MCNKVHHGILHSPISLVCICETGFQSILDRGKFGVISVFLPFHSQLNDKWIDLMCSWCLFCKELAVHIHKDLGHTMSNTHAHITTEQCSCTLRHLCANSMISHSSF